MKKKIGLLVLIQVLLLGGIGVFVSQKNCSTVEVSLDSWQSQQASYDAQEKQWYADSAIGTEAVTEAHDEESSEAHTIYGPNIDLKRGSYTVTVEYETDSTGTVCTFAADGETGQNSGLNYSDVTLNSTQKSTEIDIEATEKLENFEVRFDYDGSGSLKINNITIKENRNRELRHLTCLFFLFLLIDLGFLFRGKIQEHRREFVLLIGITFFASLPMMIPNFYNGHDLKFHMLRIEGIMQELQLGHFPARMHSISCWGYGHPVSIYYGDLLLYIPAVLRMLGFSVLGAYKIYVYLINLATTVVTYCCLHKISKRRVIAMTGTIVYTLGAYRIVDIYVRGSLGEYTAMLVFPVIALAIYQMYTADEEDWKEYRKNAGLLILGMSGLITSHILSTEMVALFLAILAIVLIKKTVRKNTLKVWGLSVVGTILVNAWFLVPFVDYYMNVDANINHRMDDGVLKIQEHGAYIGQYFSFFQNIRGYSVEQVCERMQLTPGMVLMAALLIAMYLLFIGKRNKKCAFYVGFSAFALFMASDLFPWDAFAKYVPGFQFLASVQFPWRYIAIAVIFLTLLLGELLPWLQKEYGLKLKYSCCAIMMLSLVMMCTMTGQLFDTGKSTLSTDGGDVRTYAGASLDKAFIGDEYLRKGSYTAWIDGEYRTENMDEMTEVSKEGEMIRLHCETGDLEGAVEVPLFHYPGYHVRDEQGKEYEITDGFNNVIRFSLPAGFSGDITIDFEEPVSWRVSEIVSILSILILLCIKIRKNKKENK